MKCVIFLFLVWPDHHRFHSQPEAAASSYHTSRINGQQYLDISSIHINFIVFHRRHWTHFHRIAFFLFTGLTFVCPYSDGFQHQQCHTTNIYNNSTIFNWLVSLWPNMHLWSPQNNYSYHLPNAKTLKNWFDITIVHENKCQTKIQSKQTNRTAKFLNEKQKQNLDTVHIQSHATHSYTQTLNWRRNINGFYFWPLDLYVCFVVVVVVVAKNFVCIRIVDRILHIFRNDWFLLPGLRLCSDTIVWLLQVQRTV